MKVVILQSNYMPWRGYFDLIKNADVFCFYDEVKYTKNDWRNRNKIYSKNGLQWLTIPIDKDAVKLKISEVILPNGWENKHAETLKTVYGRASQYHQLEGLIDQLYHKNRYSLLSDFNRNAIQELSKLMGLSTEFVSSSSYNLQGDRVWRLINLLKELGATTYISGPSAKDYLQGNEHLFEENGIQLQYMKYGPYKEYAQFQLHFEPYVSILDLIAHVPLDEINDYL